MPPFVLVFEACLVFLLSFLLLKRSAGFGFALVDNSNM